MYIYIHTCKGHFHSCCCAHTPAGKCMHYKYINSVLNPSYTCMYNIHYIVMYCTVRVASEAALQLCVCMITVNHLHYSTVNCIHCTVYHIISYHIIIIQVHHAQSHTRANCPMQHYTMNQNKTSRMIRLS